MNDRWIKLYESLSDWGWYKDQYVKGLFIHLLIKANYKDLEFKGYKIKRGQCVTSIRHLADDLGMSDKTVQRCLACLKSTKEIKTKVTKNFTIITICNYENYQGVVNNTTLPTTLDTTLPTTQGTNKYRSNKYTNGRGGSHHTAEKEEYPEGFFV